jgi:NAD-specific glutamate dehydrogenase
MAEPKKLENGKWQIRFRYKDPITNVWKNKMITDDTRKAVNARYTDFMAKANKGQLQAKVSLLDFFDEYVETFKKGKVSKVTLNKYATTRSSLERFFGTKQTLRGIDKLSYQKFINWLAEEGGSWWSSIKGHRPKPTRYREICLPRSSGYGADL